MIMVRTHVSNQSAPIIRRSFQKLHLHPLAPPESKVAVTAAIDCATGRKSVELGIVAKAQLQVDDVTVKRSNDPMVILRAGMKSNRNILVWSVAYEILNTTLLQSSQEKKRINQQHLETK